jgi:hypothetical protein
MKILYLTTRDPALQGDFSENMVLLGLNRLLGPNVYDYPKKKVLYGDFSESPRDSLHGRGFTLYTRPLLDLNEREKSVEQFAPDVILYGVANQYGITDFPEINKLTPNVWYIDGGDSPVIIKKPSFKREYVSPVDGVYPMEFGIPSYQIKPIIYTKLQKVQKTAPQAAFCVPHREEGRSHYIFNNELSYWVDMGLSWFGLTCKKGGWSSLRTLEIVACGSLCLFMDYDKKPSICAPQNFPTKSYSTWKECEDIMNSLVFNNKPTKEYWELLFAQREWLIKYGTCEAIAANILKTISQNLK